jgi:hypothetical protein
VLPAGQLSAHCSSLPLGGDDVLAGSARVGNVKNNDPTLIEPIAAD